MDTDKLVHTTEVVRYVNGGQAKKDLAAGLITQEEYDAMVAMTREINNTATGARLYLWSCALAEIRQSPILGGGIMSFENKYSSYPHNYRDSLLMDIAGIFSSSSRNTTITIRQILPSR